MANEFSVVVWFKYVIAEIIKEDFEIHLIEAYSEEEAIGKAMYLYRKSGGKIPFKTELL